MYIQHMLPWKSVDIFDEIQLNIFFKVGYGLIFLLTNTNAKTIELYTSKSSKSF